MKQKTKLQVLWEFMTEDWYFVAFSVGWLLAAVLIIFLVFLYDTPPGSKELLPSYVSLFAAGMGVAFAFRQRWNSMVRMQSTKHVPVVVVTGRSRTDAKHLLDVAKGIITKHTGFKQFKQMENHFRVSIEDNLLITDESKLRPDDHGQWQRLLDRIQDGVHRASDQIAGEKVYHIFVFGYGASSLALALGAVFGTRYRVIVYQFISGDEWQPVLDLTDNIRKIKEAPGDSNFQYAKTSAPQQVTPELALVLDMGSRPITHFVQRHLASKNQANWALVKVNDTYQGNLKEKDWTRAVQELFAIYNLMREQGVSQIHLFLDAPTAMCFGLGVAMGIYNKVVVYAWDNHETYYPVFSLDKLEGIL